jgi:hypothetical protein
MRPAETIATLAGFEKRSAGTDAERRAARWLRSQVETPGREAHLEPFWCRPNWALANAWHAALGIAGSLVAESEPRVGGALIVLALVSLIADAGTGMSLGRRLTPERASQNVVSEVSSDVGRVHLVVAANYDAGRSGLIYRERLRGAAARLATATGHRAPGWLAWMAIALVWLIAIAVLRLEGHRSTLIGVLQLIPTVGLVIAVALLVEQGSATPTPGMNDNASGTAAAIALIKALDAAPPKNLAVDLVLEGAGDGSHLGFRQYLRKRRGIRTAPNTVVLGVAPCGSGRARWFDSDGQLVPLAYFKELRRLCESVAREDPTLGADGHRGRGSTAALPARERRLPAIALGSIGGGGELDPEAVDRTVEFGLLLVDQIDAYVGSRRTAAPRRTATPA